MDVSTQHDFRRGLLSPGSPLSPESPLSPGSPVQGVLGMNEITVRNFRCFRDEQKARLAPLTILVGENSTGKTSLMALIRALSDLGYRDMLPDFKEEPYDLGSFDEIAHYRGPRAGRATHFEAGFKVTRSARRKGRGLASRELCFSFVFARERNQPVLARKRLQQGESFVELDLEKNRVFVGTSNGRWQVDLDSRLRPITSLEERRIAIPRFFDWLLSERLRAWDDREPGLTSLCGPSSPSEEDRESLRELSGFDRWKFRAGRPYASAPVRSKPRRTYDPARLTRDPEGGAVPMYLADLSRREPRLWAPLREGLESFGRASGLFDEIRVRRLGPTSSEPFQIQVRKSGTPRLKGPWRNLTDIGYGISQVLPVITELLRPTPRRRSVPPNRDEPEMFLLQQPEVHLHPSAQAALGTFFCTVAARGRQLIVETHGDHLIDRVRMDVRDRTTKLAPEDVSILFFQRKALEVEIHSLRVDEAGNVLGAPDDYRKFFLEETNRSIGL